ncbi:MAG: hypothetical protein GY811_12710 [Myxococcales bacterium]|nr:hypothetical protein [Myxococcales bacterium]
MSKKKHNRKISNYLIDKKLQLRYVIFVTTLSALICGMLGFLIWQQADVATNIIREQLADAPDMADEVIRSLKSEDQNLIFTMVASGVGLIVLLSLLLVVMTHKVAGPLFKVTRYLDKMRDGRLDTVWPLRKGDMLQNFYLKFSAMHTSVKARHVETNETLKNFVALAEAAGIDASGDQGHRLDELRKHCEQRSEALA